MDDKELNWIIGLIILVVIFFVSPQLGILIVGIALLGLFINFLGIIWEITKEVLEYVWIMIKVQRMQNLMETLENMFSGFIQWL